jgi:hypothetical protein
VHALGRPVLAIGRTAKRVVTKTQQRGLVMIRHQPDVATTSAVTAVGTTLGHVGLTSKTDASRPAVAGLGVQLGRIDEATHRSILRPTPRGYPTSSSRAASNTR